jgi:hypothetical protein
VKVAIGGRGDAGPPILSIKISVARHGIFENIA